MTDHSFFLRTLLILTYVLVLATRLAHTAPTRDARDDLGEQAMQSGVQKLRASNEATNNSMASVSDSYPPYWVRQIWQQWPAFNFEEYLTTCDESQTNAIATTFSGTGMMQARVAQEKYRMLPDTNTVAWDWFFMKDNPSNPYGWSRDKYTFKAWRAISAKDDNIEIMRAAPRLGRGGNGTNLTKKPVVVYCGDSTGYGKCSKRTAWAYTSNPNRDGNIDRWELHFCDKFFSLGRNAEYLLTDLIARRSEGEYLSDLKTREGVLLHEFGHMHNFEYVWPYEPFDIINRQIPCTVSPIFGKIYGPECAFKLAWFNRFFRGQERFERPNEMAAFSCENYAWWHVKRWFDLNEWIVPLKNSLIPGGGIPLSSSGSEASEMASKLAVWNDSSIQPEEINYDDYILVGPDADGDYVFDPNW